MQTQKGEPAYHILNSVYVRSAIKTTVISRLDLTGPYAINRTKTRDTRPKKKKSFTQHTKNEGTKYRMKKKKKTRIFSGWWCVVVDASRGRNTHFEMTLFHTRGSTIHPRLQAKGRLRLQRHTPPSLLQARPLNMAPAERRTITAQKKVSRGP